MPAFNISCTVCKEIFKDSDSIYTTSCGHVFHYFCMAQWKTRSSTCPQCRKYNPETHPIYLSFERIEDFEEIICMLKEKLKKFEDNENHLRTKLKNKVEKIKNLNETIVKKQNKIDDIQKLYNISENWRAEFQDKIQNITEENEKLRKNQLPKTNNEIQSTINNSDNENTNKIDDEQQQIITVIKEENKKLHETITELETSKMVSDYKIEMLEQRLKHLNLELKQQISQTMNRSMDNVNQANDKSKHVDTDYHLKTPTESMENLNCFKNDKIKKPTLKPLDKFELKQPNDCKVLIKDYPKNELLASLVNTVISLASKMFIDLTNEDILNVSTIDKVRSNEIAILVEFKTIDKKIEFLSSKHRLRKHTSTRCIQIIEYVDEKIYPILMYAKRNLRSKGYQYVWCKDNKVFAKKSIYDTNEIAIESRNDVDKLLGHTYKFELTQPNDCKVLIKDYPKNELEHSLKKTVIVLAAKMSISLTDDDILNVSIKDTVSSNQISLLVEFKSINTKIEFLSCRNRLKSHASTKGIQVKEYIDEKIYPIFMYANRHLRSKGYEYVCCRNNKVFAKKSINDTNEIAIKNRNDVDRLLGRTNVTYTPLRSNNRKRGETKYLRAYSPANSYDGSYRYDSPIMYSPESSIYDPFDYIDWD